MNLFIFYFITLVIVMINGQRIDYNQTLDVKERNCTLSKFSSNVLWKNCIVKYYPVVDLNDQKVILSVYKTPDDERATEFYKPGKLESIHLTKYQRIKEFCAYINVLDKIRQQQTIRIQSSCEQDNISIIN